MPSSRAPREHNDYVPESIELETRDPLDNDDVNVSNDQDNDNDPDRFKHGGRPSSLSSDSEADLNETYSAEEERAILRKLDVNLVLFMSFLYLLSFVDRSNIGNAKIAGMMEDLDLSDNQFDWLLTGFYITYIAFEWMILLYNYLTPHVYISICVMSWGLIASLQSVVTSFPQLLILRTCLGIGEAAFSPGVPYYLSFFYRREELALRAGLQVSAAPLASSFAGSLAYVITELGDRSPISSWRLLFLLEGFPSIIIGVIAWSFVPDNAGNAKFLTPREQAIATHRLREASSTDGAEITKPHSSGDRKISTLKERVNWAEIFETVRDPKCYLTALMFLSCNIAFSSMPVFLPTVIHEMGYTSIHSQALSAPPFLFAFVALLLIAKASDRLQSRGLFVCFAASLSLFGYGLIALGGLLRWSNTIRYLCVYPAAAGFFSAITIIITWTMNNQESNAKKGMGMTILNVVGQCGPLIGTRLYPDHDKPYYVLGMSVCAIAMVVVIALSLTLREILRRENAKMAKQRERDDTAGVELLQDSGRGGGTRRRFVYLI